MTRRLIPTGPKTLTVPEPRFRVKAHHLRKVYLLFLVIFGVLAVMAAVAWQSIKRAEHSGDWLNQTYATIHALDLTLSNLRAGDAAVRTFVLSADEHDLAAVREAFGEMSDHWQTARALLRHQDELAAPLDELETLITAREGWGRKIMAAREEGRSDEVQALLAADASTGGMADIIRAFSRLRAAQLELIGARDAESFHQMQTTRWIVGIGIAVNLILFAAVLWLIRDDQAAHERLHRTLRDANEALEARVHERTHELVTANEKLTLENLERQWSNQALEHQLRYNQQIVNSVEDLVFVTTKVLNVTRINPAVTHCTGLVEKELLGKSLQTVLGLEGADSTVTGWAAVARALRDGRDLCGQAANLTTKSGTKIAATLNLFPLRDGNKVVGSVFILRPVSLTNFHSV